MDTNQEVAIKNICQIFHTQHLKPKTVRNYVGRIRVLCEFILGTAFNKHHPYPTLQQANDIFKDFQNVVNAINKKFPIQNPKEDRGNVENQKATYVAIVSMTRTKQFENITEDIVKNYLEKLTELSAQAMDNTVESKPTKNMEKVQSGVDWDFIISKREEYIQAMKNSYTTFKKLHYILPIAFQTFMPPRRLEYRMLKVFLDEVPADVEKGTNYLLVKNNKIVMVLDEFKNRTRLDKETGEQKEILKKVKTTLPKPLTDLVKLYIARRTPTL